MGWYLESGPRTEGNRMIDKELLDILACPLCKTEVVLDEANSRLICTRCGRRYPIRDGIPVMLIDEAEPGPPPSKS
jgi:hypothetical protein